MKLNNPNIAILLLAAGASRRMGQPKQLLKINEQQTLLEHTIHAAQATPCQQITVVLGANATAIQTAIHTTNISVVYNPLWEEGMGTSLRIGLKNLLDQNNSLAAVIISVCDQPYLTADIFLNLLTQYQDTKSPIVVADYGQQRGVPALLDKEFFSQLLRLQGDTGARSIIKQHQALVTTIDFPKGAIDLDTPEAYQAYLTRSKK